MAITPLPTPPARSDSNDVFVARADAFIAALPTFVTQTNIDIGITNANTVAVAANTVAVAANAASSAASSADALAASVVSSAAANASKWVSGTNYSQGAGVWSPINFFSYRCKIAGVSTVDPSLDTTNWAAIVHPTLSDVAAGASGLGSTFLDVVRNFELGGAAFTNIATIARLIAAAGEGASLVTETTASRAVLPTDTDIIANFAGIVTLTLPSAVAYPNRRLTVRTITANTVISASANIVPVAGGAAGTAILAGTAGKWAMLVSDGTNWQIQAQG